MEMSFGFDTATKVYSELTGNLGLDAISAKKTYHFVRLMGRSASHITLEVALQTHPNLTLIGEEVEAKKQTLAQCVNAMVELILERAALGKHYGLIILVRLVGELILAVGRLPLLAVRVRPGWLFPRARACGLRWCVLRLVWMPVEGLIPLLLELTVSSFLSVLAA